MAQFLFKTHFKVLTCPCLILVSETTLFIVISNLSIVQIVLNYSSISQPKLVLFGYISNTGCEQTAWFGSTINSQFLSSLSDKSKYFIQIHAVTTSVSSKVLNISRFRYFFYCFSVNITGPSSYSNQTKLILRDHLCMGSQKHQELLE